MVIKTLYKREEFIIRKGAGFWVALSGGIVKIEQ